MATEFNELIKMAPSKKKPNPGDVFVVQPKEGLYYFGRVMKTNIVNPKNAFINGWNLIYIYNHSASDMSLTDPEKLDKGNLLLPPEIVNNQGWIKGYFQMIGNVPFQDSDFLEDYGFWDIVSRKFYNEEGEIIETTPKVQGTYGLGSYGVIGRNVQRILEGKPLPDIMNIKLV